MKTLAIFGDTYTASTGFAVVLRNLANELTRYFRVIYFGRFGQEKEFAPRPILPDSEFFQYVPCRGGVWDRELVVRILKHYPEIDYVFTEDDFYSVHGILGACLFWEKPFHLHTPIDSLPVNDAAFNSVFTYCDKIYIPNSSYQRFNGRQRLNFPEGDVGRERQGDTLKALRLDHGVDTDIFYPDRYVPREDKFTFLWSGRMEPRKSPGRVLKAWEMIHNKMDAILHMRGNWDSPLGSRVLQYIHKKNLPIKVDLMEDIPHYKINDVYNKGDVNVCTAKAGGFEMSITEAASCEVPSIVTDASFMNEVVVDNETGWLVPVDGYCHPPEGYNLLAQNRLWGNISVEHLSKQMEWCYLNQSKVKMMGRYARVYVKDKYNWRTIAYRLKEEILHEG